MIIENAKPAAVHIRAFARRCATSTPPASSPSTTHGSQVPTATARVYRVSTSTTESFCRSGTERLTVGMFAANAMPWSTSRCFTSSMTGPSSSETVPSPPSWIAESGSPCIAATRLACVNRRAAENASANAGDSTTRVTARSRSVSMPCAAGPSSSPSAVFARSGMSRALMPSNTSLVSDSMSTCCSMAVVISSATKACTCGFSASGANVATKRSVSTSSMRAHAVRSAIGASSRPTTTSTTAAKVRPRPRRAGFATGSRPRRASFSASRRAIRASSSDTPAFDMMPPLHDHSARGGSGARFSG